MREHQWVWLRTTACIHRFHATSCISGATASILVTKHPCHP